LGESLDDDGDILGVRKTVRTSPSLIANKIINIEEGIFGLSNGDRRIEDGDLGKPSTRGHIRRSSGKFFPFSEAFLLSSKTVGTVGQEVSLDVKNIGSIDERDDDR